MDDQAREPFKEKAKRDKEQTKANPTYYDGPKPPQPKPVEIDIMTTQGQLYSVIKQRREEEAQFEKDMKRRIADLIDYGFLNNSKYCHCNWW